MLVYTMISTEQAFSRKLAELVNSRASYSWLNAKNGGHSSCCVVATGTHHISSDWLSARPPFSQVVIVKRVPLASSVRLQVIKI